MSWTDDRVSLLTKLWGEGHSASQIAKELGGVTRNAVIGKAHRLKLARRASPIQQNKKKTVKKAVAKKKVTTQTSPKTKTVKATRAPRKKSVKVPVRHVEDLISIENLTGSMCRFPIGDPQHKDFGFCGHDSIQGLPYCHEHAEVAYQPATRKRIAKDQEKREEAMALALLKKAANQ